MTTATPLEVGRIVLVIFPFTDATGAKLRPALVVWASDKSEDFVAVPISKRLEQDGFQILKSDSYFSQTKLKFDSTVKWNKPATLSRRVVDSLLGTIPSQPLAQIRQHIKGLFS